jgi:hypothetical protein
MIKSTLPHLAYGSCQRSSQRRSPSPTEYLAAVDPRIAAYTYCCTRHFTFRRQQLDTTRASRYHTDRATEQAAPASVLSVFRFAVAPLPSVPDPLSADSTARCGGTNHHDGVCRAWLVKPSLQYTQWWGRVTGCAQAILRRGCCWWGGAPAIWRWRTRSRSLVGSRGRRLLGQARCRFHSNAAPHPSQKLPPPADPAAARPGAISRQREAALVAAGGRSSMYGRS